MSLYAKFQIKWWLHDHFSVPFRCLYLPNAWSQTLHKAHTFRVSAFHQKHWFEVRLFPVGCAQDSRRVTSKREKMLFFGSGSVLAIKFRNFYDSTPRHLWQLVAEIAAIRRFCIVLRVRYKYYKKNSRSGFWPTRHRGLSRHTSVFRTTIGVICYPFRLRFGRKRAKNLFWSKTENSQAFCLAVNERVVNGQQKQKIS